METFTLLLPTTIGTLIGCIVGFTVVAILTHIQNKKLSSQSFREVAEKRLSKLIAPPPHYGPTRDIFDVDTIPPSSPIAPTLRVR